MTTQKGVILMMTLFYLTVITLLVMAAFDTSILQIKIQAGDKNVAQAFQNTESALVIVEKQLTGQESTGGGSLSNATYQYQKLSATACQVDYQIDAIGKKSLEVVHLQSILQVTLHNAQCKAPAAKKRIAWQEIL
ncbi:MAG: hypothetical protein QM752_07785 [Gammaproteobacteria bacterium]